jgi:Predicted Zn-dependent protease (DUF2268)
MPVDLHIMDKAKLFSDAEHSMVLNVLKDTLAKVENCCPLGDLDLVIFPTENYTHPEGYHGGFTFSANCLEISVNPKHSLFATRFETEFPALILHEVHHCLRYRHVGVWTVGELVVLEGLAMSAEIAFGDRPLPTHSAMSEEALLKLCRKACGTQDDEGFEKSLWVYGRDSDEETPYIYLIGSKIVSSALGVMDKNAFEAVGESSRKLLGLGSETLMLDVHRPRHS